MSTRDFLDQLEEKTGVKISLDQRNAIKDRLGAIISYKPKVGVFGKTGVGKSSLCNALFGHDICPINDVESCTREPKEVILNIGGQGITLLDVPGVGESQERNIEYGKLYNSLLPELDIVLWVLKGDDRAFAEDEIFYKTIVKPHINHSMPFFFVLNQADKIEPFREWDVANHTPGPNQLANIERKKTAVSQAFQIPTEKVIPVSANEKYKLVDLVDSIVFALPRDKRISFAREIPEENLSEISREAVKKSWAEAVEDVIRENTGSEFLAKTGAALASAAELAVDIIIEKAGKVAEKAISFFKSLFW